MKNLVVSGRIYRDKNGELCTSYEEDILKMLNKLDMLIKPCNISKKINYSSLKKSDGLILLGGGNINKIEKKKVNKIRDEYEKKLFQYFVKQQKPIVGICRGFQNIVSFYGINPCQVRGHVRTKHHIKINKSRFIKFRSLNVNSYHNYAIKSLPKNYSVVSKLFDGTIEIAEHNTKKILCLMFHPERKMSSQSKIVESLKKFFS